MKIVMLAGKGQSTLFMYNALKDDFNIIKVIIEDKLAYKTLVKGRIRKLGYFKVLNQLAFQLLVPKILALTSKKRISAIKKQEALSDATIPAKLVKEVSSVNSKECITLLVELDPDIILVNGTRIINKKVLNASKAIFINTHVGITPQYRGVHGAYWALTHNDHLNCGVTVHQVDSGIDTGGIIKQANITFNNDDNFLTYPYLQYGLGIRLMKETLNDIEKGIFSTYKKENVGSKLYYHPTLTGYFYNRIFKGIK